MMKLSQSMSWRRLCALCMAVLALPLSARAEAVPELLEPVGVAINTTIAHRGELSKIAVYDGSVVPYVEELYMPTEGTVAEVHVIVGQQVKAGDPLLTLDREKQQERIAALEEQIEDIDLNAAYDDRLAELDAAILETELQILEGQYPRDEKAIALKQLDIEACRMQQEYAMQLRAMEREELCKELAELEQDVDQAVLRAPFDGRVMHLVALERGSSVQAYAPLIYLADDTRLSIQAEYIPGITSTAYHALYALVRDGRCELEPIPLDQADYISRSLAGEKVMMNFRILSADGLYAAGDYAALCVETNYVADALLIPANTLYSDSSGRYVYVMENGERLRRNVTLGVMTDWDVEVIQGLEEGAVVCVKD